MKRSVPDNNFTREEMQYRCINQLMDNDDLSLIFNNQWTRVKYTMYVGHLQTVHMNKYT